MRRHQSKLSAFTLIELIVLIGIIVLIAGIAIPGGIRWRQKAKNVRCVSHLKQIGLSFRLWPPAQKEVFPMVVSETEGGTMEVSNEVWRTMLVMSNELGSPIILACPSDSREAATNFATLSNSNISYFIGLDGDDSTPEMPLLGDRFLSTGRAPVNKVLTIKSNDVPAWSGRGHLGGGNMALADGSVQQYTTGHMRSCITNAIRINWQASSNATLRLAMPE